MPKPNGDDKAARRGRVRDLPRVYLTITPEMLKHLNALSEVEGRSAWRVVEDALRVYLASLPDAERIAVARQAAGKPLEGPHVLRLEFSHPGLAEAVKAFLKLWERPAEDLDGLEIAARNFIADSLGVPRPDQKKKPSN
jgi:hypothetical protein